ncbi:MAG TPA: hypothetical protein VGL60_02320 [Acidimicrobiales bacterium]
MDKGQTLRSWADGGRLTPGATDEIAGPGDPDLYCDVHGATIQTVLRYESEFYLLLKGGRGWTTDPMTAAPRDIMTEELVESSFAYLPSEDQVWILDNVEELLRRWATDRAPLRLTCALWRVGSLSDEAGSFVPLPPL